MNGRNNFFRLQHWQLAERQRYLSELESLGERLRVDVARLRDEIDEAGGVASVPANGSFDPLFIRPLLERRDKLLRSITEIDAQIVDARAAVLNSQQEVKLMDGAIAHRTRRFDEPVTRRIRRSP